MLVRWYYVLALGFVLLLVVAWEASTIPHYVNDCTYQYETYVKHCTDLNTLLFFLSKTADILERYAGAITAIFTIVLAFSTVGLWRSTKKLWVATNAAVELGNKEFISANRPHLRLKHIWLATPDGERFFGHIQAGTQIIVRLDIVNCGIATAFVRTINFMTYLVPLGQRLPQRPPYNEPGVPKVSVHDLPLESGRTLTLPITVEQILSAENVEAIRVGQGRLYFIGTIEYWWGTDRDHLRGTAFCRYLRFEWPIRPDDTGRF